MARVRAAVQTLQCGFQIRRQVFVCGACVAVWTQQSIRREGCAEDVIESRKVERSADLSQELSETCACTMMIRPRRI
eukprot:14824140-Alexandrium_andersonii.AAC.1